MWRYRCVSSQGAEGPRSTKPPAARRLPFDKGDSIPKRELSDEIGRNIEGTRVISPSAGLGETWAWSDRGMAELWPNHIAGIPGHHGATKGLNA